MNGWWFPYEQLMISSLASCWWSPHEKLMISLWKTGDFLMNNWWFHYETTDDVHMKSWWFPYEKPMILWWKLMILWWTTDDFMMNTWWFCDVNLMIFWVRPSTWNHGCPLDPPSPPGALLASLVALGSQRINHKFAVCSRRIFDWRLVAKYTKKRHPNGKQIGPSSTPQVHFLQFPGSVLPRAPSREPTLYLSKT
jgi:hypothetical protein